SEHFPGQELEHAYDAAAIAAEQRAARLAARRSFVSETVFSHESKVALLRLARDAGYLVTLHVVLFPEDLAVARVASRVRHGGHDVPEEKVRGRFARLWHNVVDAIPVVDQAYVYDNSRAANAFRLVAAFDHGRLVGEAAWPRWTPEVL